MTIATATITGSFVGPDLTGDKVMSATYEAYADGTAVTYTGLGVIGGRRRIDIQDDGTATVTIPKIPQAGLLPAAGVFWLVRVHLRGRTLQYFFTLAADTTWDAVLTPANAATAPTLLGDVITARDAAVAAASAVRAGTWQASTAYVSNQIVQSPNSGAMLRRISGGSSRPTFDATEQALWLPVSGVWDVRTFDAVADGTTNNATAINNAITACNAAGGGTVLVPAAASQWATGSAIVMKAKVSLMVFGTIKALASHGGVGVDITNVTNVQICGPGTIDMNKAATTSSGGVTPQHGILIRASTGAATVSQVVVRDVTVQNSWQQNINVSATTTGGVASRIKVENVTSTSSNAGGILVDCLGDTSVTPTQSISSDIRITRCTITSPGTQGIQCKGVSDVWVDNNIVNGSGTATGHGICMGAGGGGVTTDQVTDFTVRDNDVRGFTSALQWGIVLSARCTRFKVDGNLSIGNRGGMTCDLTDPNHTSTVVIADGTIANNTFASSTFTHGLNVVQAQALQVIGNVCRANAGTGIAVSGCSGLPITGNTAINNTAAGIGIFGTSAGGGHSVKGNTVTGNGQQFYQEAPVVSVIDASSSASLTAVSTVSNTVAETTQWTQVIPGQRDQVGTTYRLALGYTIDNIATSGTLTLRIWGPGSQLLGSVVIPSQVGAATNQAAFVDALITVRTTGGTGKVMLVGNIRSEFSSLSKAFTNLVQTGDASVGYNLLVTAQWATANVGNVCRLEVAAVDPVKT